MSRENVEVVRQAYDALNRRDADAFLEHADPAVVQDWSRSVGMEPGTSTATTR